MSGKVFISYHAQDRSWKDALVTQLEGRGIESWNNDLMESGVDREEAIKQTIEQCSIAIILVSSHFLADKVHEKHELAWLLARFQDKSIRRLIPLLVRPTALPPKDWLGDESDRRPRGGKSLAGLKDEAEAAIAELVEEINALLDPIPGSWTKPVSYRGNALNNYLTCDRDAQHHDFNSRFTNWFQGQRGLPQFYIIHGRKEDRPGSLVRRLGKIELDVAVAWLKKHKRLETGAAPLFKEVAWPVMIPVDQLDLAPQYADLINNLFKSFSDNEKCSFYPDEQSWPAIFAGFCNDPVIAISHEITKWDKPAQALAERYQKFWRDVRDELSKRSLPPQFLILLHVHYPPETKPGNWFTRLIAQKTDEGERVSRDLRELNQKLVASGFQAHVMGKLTEITAEDVYKWATECQYTERDSKFRNRIEKFYGNRKQMPMIEVEEWLEERCRELSERESGLHKGA